MPDTETRPLASGEGGLHRDGAKARLADYFPPDLMWHVGEIVAENCRKTPDYPEGKYPDIEGGFSNFKGGIRVLKLMDSTWRHFLKILMGEDIDDESGRPHIAHMICDLCMAYWTIRHRPDMDDRLWTPSLSEGYTSEEIIASLEPQRKEAR
jgi:hypothetical protein